MPCPNTLGRPASLAFTSSVCIGLKSPDAPAYITRSVRVSWCFSSGALSPSFTSSKYRVSDTAKKLLLDLDRARWAVPCRLSDPVVGGGGGVEDDGVARVVLVEDLGHPVHTVARPDARLAVDGDPH